jgi:hypothetical protein
MEHETPEQFVVNPPVSNTNLEARAECLKQIEPAIRIAGRAIDWSKFNNSFSSGELADITSGDPEKVKIVVDKFVNTEKEHG